MTRKKVVDIKNLCSSYQDNTVLEDLNLEIFEGDIVGLIGDSGSGKSTIAYIMAGLKGFDSGSVDCNQKELGFVMQNPQTALDPLKTIFYTLRETKTTYLKSINAPIPNKKIMIKELENWLLKVNMSKDRLFDYPHQFSGGELQRISIIRALLKEAKFLILDEPTSMLDVLVQAKIIYLLLDLKREFNLTYLFISHDIDLINKVCDYYYEIIDKKVFKKT